MKKKFPRLLKLPNQRSFFLFGARNTGKSTLIRERYAQSSLFIDLLTKAIEARFSRNPDELHEIVMGLPEETTHVIIDEVQKNPLLLDVVHRLMGETNKFFVMTGSSARKLKQGGANLLAGRAFVYNMYPLTHIELGDTFNLDQALQWGTLPELFTMDSDEEKSEFLYAYAHTYLKEEVWNEHFIRDLDPFRRFLEVVAQSNGKQINFSNIAKDVGVSDKTIKSYFAILEDTLIGFFLEPYLASFRKRLSHQPKFYLFDTGVTRALAFLTTVKLERKTKAFGDAFEHFIILECIRLSSYHRLQYKFSYLRTKDDVEIDLIVERPGKPLLCIEIKSSEEIRRDHISSFISISKDIEHSEAICICNEEFAKKFDHVTVLPWRIALQKYFFPETKDMV
jgi:predicted AAA+ superfamily ATPase